MGNPMKVGVLFIVVVISCSFFSSNDSVFSSTENYNYVNGNTNQLISILDKSVLLADSIFIEKRLDLIITQKFFYKFLKKNNLNIYVVNILTSLIFLNISPLHHSPYREFLYFLGLDCLKKTIDNHEIIL
jgi:hypothetical protein